MESSKSPRGGKHHSRSRSRSRDRKRKSGDKKHRRSRSRSKEARRRDSDKAARQQSRSEEVLSSDKERERFSEDSGEERHRRKERKSSRGRSQSRSRSRDRKHRSRSRDRRMSLSRSRERRSRSREKKRRPRSKSRSRSRSRHKRSRSRSKSRKIGPMHVKKSNINPSDLIPGEHATETANHREKKRRIEKVKVKSRSPITPVPFRGRNTAMDAQEALARRLERAKKLQEQKEKELLEKQQQQQQEIAAVAAVAAPLLCDSASSSAASQALNVAALLASGTQVTPQIAMAAQMAALQAKTLAETGIAVPSYYNPSAVNPMKFAEQEKKRKLLWQGKKEGDKSQTAELWEKLNFGNKDQNVKFRKLMGIKADEETSTRDLNADGLKTLQQQEEMFRNLDVQYEMARSQTHTQRGMGLGFSSAFSRGTDPV